MSQNKKRTISRKLSSYNQGMTEKISVHAIDDTTFAYQQPLAFRAPMAELTSAPTLFENTWRMIQFVFPLPSPDLAVSFNGLATEPHAALIKRFVTEAESLARSKFLAEPSGYSVTWKRDVGETIEAWFPDDENERGFMVLLRQFVDAAESASFNAIQAIAIAHAKSDGPNLDLLRTWGKVHKKLLTRPPKVWLALEVHRDLTQVPFGNHPEVRQLFRAYSYGDLIHYGDQREELENLKSSLFEEVSHRVTFHEGAEGLACFYMGYAAILSKIYQLPNRGTSATIIS